MGVPLLIMIMLYSEVRCVLKEVSTCGHERSSRGNEFWLGFMNNFVTSSVHLHLYSDKNGSARVNSSRLGYDSTFHLHAPTYTTRNGTEVNLGYSFEQDGTSQMSKTVQIKSKSPMAVFRTRRVTSCSDLPLETFMALPVSALSTKYIITSYPPSNGYYSKFIVTGLHDKTHVKITLKMDGYFIYQNKRYQQNDVLEILLHSSANSFQLQHVHDLSGTLVETDFPVAVYSGTQVTRKNYGFEKFNFVVEHTPSVDHYGYRFIVPGFSPRRSYFIRVYASEDSTSVDTFSFAQRGPSSHIINAYEFFDVHFEDPVRVAYPAVVVSDKPITVVQFSNIKDTRSNVEGWSGMSMSVVPSVDQFSKYYQFPSDTSTHNYVAITMPKSQSSTRLLLNRNRLYHPTTVFNVPAPMDDYVVIIQTLNGHDSELMHTYSWDTFTFGAMVYGFNQCKDTTYSFPAGITFPAKSCTTPHTVPTTSVTRQVVSNLGSATAVPVSFTTLTPLRPVPPGTRMRCFSCTGMTHLRFCDTITECNEHEVCFVESYHMLGGHRHYRTGCSAVQHCSSTTSSREEQIECRQCCSSDFCNKDGCGDLPYPARDSRGPVCLDCAHLGDPTKCEAVAMCQLSQMCSIEEFQWGTETQYKMGCMSASYCPGHCTGSDCPHGRKRVTARCHHCCDSDFCNTNCTSLRNAPVVG